MKTLADQVSFSQFILQTLLNFYTASFKLHIVRQTGDGGGKDGQPVGVGGLPFMP
jgi:hypothetical protein